MALVQLDDPKVRIKLGAAAVLAMLALFIGLRGGLFRPATDPVDAAAVDAGNAVVAQMRAHGPPPPEPTGDEAPVEPGSGQLAQPTR